MTAESRATRRDVPSRVSDKQIAHAVAAGRQVTVVLPDGSKISGYVSGRDAFHWVLITPDLDTVLVHKSAPAVIIGKQTVDTEARKDEIEKIVSPFRAFVLEKDLGRCPE